jgi:hypothetical protein
MVHFPSENPHRDADKPVVSGHTPGPWVRDRCQQLRGSDGEQVGVWDAGISWVSRSPVAEANARLIAAAPELLEAVVGLVRGREHVWSPELEAARAAIAKATGAA